VKGVSDPAATHQTVTGQTPKGYESRAYDFQSIQKAVLKKKYMYGYDQFQCKFHTPRYNDYSRPSQIMHFRV